MKGRMLASVVMTAIGASLLAAAMFASTAAGAGAAATAKKGGTLTIVNRSDFDYVDPGLAYFSHSWNMMGATQLTLLYYPQTEGPAGNRLAGWRRTTAEGVQRREDLHLHDQEGLQVQRRQAGDGRELQAGVRSRQEREHAVAGVVVPGRRRELQAPNGPDLHRQPEGRRSGLPGPDVDDVLRGRAGRTCRSRPRASRRRSSRPARTTSRSGTRRAPLCWCGTRTGRTTQEPFKSLGFAANVDQIRWIAGAGPRDAAAHVRAGRGRPLRLPAGAGDGARREVRHQQEPVLRQAADRATGTSR